MSDRVLVTGATGFIGQHLVEALVEQGDQVDCLVRPTSDTSSLPIDQLELRLGDVTDSATLGPTVEGIDIVYHLAGALEARTLAELNGVNEAGARNVAQACADQATPPIIVLLSSIEAAGPDPERHIRTEEDSPSPVSNYGRSKLAGERSMREFADSVPITIVRASGVFGEGDVETYGILKALQVPGLDVYAIPRAHSAKVSVIHARDLADLMVMAAHRGERIQLEAELHEQGLYYGADEEQLTLGELFGRVAEALSENPATIVEVPIGFAWVTAGIVEGWARIRGRSPGVITLDKIRSFAAGSFTCSPEKARQQLAFKPTRPLTDRIKQTVNWYQAQGWL
ncbi:MAG: NAD-dependent epimerase/dehydratase family protein [Anaerolineales bacterium]